VSAASRTVLPCPHCDRRPLSLDMHLRFDCPVIRPHVDCTPVGDRRSPVRPTDAEHQAMVAVPA
jgi:hypothetical protein